jgi:HlyD family secretion protein
VLQVIYELAQERQVDVFIGQQMDVYLKAAAPSKAIPHDIAGKNSPLPFDEKVLAGEPGAPGL